MQWYEQYYWPEAYSPDKLYTGHLGEKHEPLFSEKHALAFAVEDFIDYLDSPILARKNAEWCRKELGLSL